MADGSRTRKRGGKGPRGRTNPRAVAKGHSRRSPAKTDFEAALDAVIRFLDTIEAPSAVIGGVAVIAWGRARNTTDIDAAISATPEITEALIARARRFGFVPRVDDAAAFATQRMVLLLRHESTGVPFDLSFAQLEFERAALSTAVVRNFGSVSVRVPDAAALIVYKMVASRPKDLEDVEDLILRGIAVDTAQVEATLRAFDEILETDRAGDFSRLLGRLQKTRRRP